jgi:RNA methyltransferase, TrmH family
MLSKNQVKFIRSLADKKSRQQSGLFVAEGEKSFRDMLGSNLRVKTVYASREWIATNRSAVAKEVELIETSYEELKKISRHQNPQDLLMLVELPQPGQPQLSGKLSILLDTIQDPGNLGTIIRIADWYGIGNIVCSPASADAFNPKAVDASMGSAGRVHIHYTSLHEIIKAHPHIPVYGALLSGENVYGMKLPREAFLLIGNEGKGISEELLSLVSRPLSIPRIGRAESLNAAIATAILCDHFARQLTSS